MRGMNTAL
ncbi:hypothetical protein EYF80_065084 [Liparis tanakae]|uniref:Uncharacterized protein n=1 Tax=Liparis tanakae TaxID=230148 RepID=A0A4Z2E892_9TELE|nr:hypothetical protein EYF80_065084 [Liparis tanakae]